MGKTLFERYVEEATCVVTLYPTVVRVLRVAELADSRVLQTEILGEDGITVVETLLTYDDDTALIIDRHRFGTGHESMRSYPRDCEFPIGSTVRLRHA